MDILTLGSQFCRYCKALIQALKGRRSSSLEWSPEHQIGFETLKEKLFSAPALALPNITKSLQLFVSEKMVPVGVI